MISSGVDLTDVTVVVGFAVSHVLNVCLDELVRFRETGEFRVVAVDDGLGRCQTLGANSYIIVGEITRYRNSL